jgi:transmembrane sensor
MDRGGEGNADEMAAGWLARLNARTVTTQELDSFYAWRRIPANAAAYARAERVWRQSQRLEADPEIAAAIEEALDRPRSRSLWHSFSRRRLLFAGATAVPIAAAGAVALWAFDRGEVHETLPGERLAFMLADGTKVDLNTASRIRVYIDGRSRRVTLERGEALFAVHRDTGRPFIVEAGAQSVRALGTSFSTHRTDDALRVVLIEGQVEVTSQGAAPARLAQPGAAALARTGRPVEQSQVDLDVASAWTRGKLIFRQTPLTAAVAEVNRYTEQQVELGDNALAQQRVDGVFEAGDIDSFVAAVTTIFGLQARSQGHIIILEPQSEAAPQKKLR